jgi:hypothetical protein
MTYKIFNATYDTYFDLDKQLIDHIEIYRILANKLGSPLSLKIHNQVYRDNIELLYKRY